MSNSNLIYFWCFDLNRDDTKSFFQRHNFGGFISGVLFVLGMICLSLCAVFLVVPFIGVVGENIVNMHICEDKSLSCVMMHTVFGGWFVVCYVLNVSLTVGILLPIFVPVVLFSSDTAKIILSAILCLVSVYQVNIVGTVTSKIFGMNKCGFDTYDNLMGMICWGMGIVTEVALILLYAVFALVGYIIYRMRQCVRDTERMREGEHLIKKEDIDLDITTEI
jgi:hypothetical protein